MNYIYKVKNKVVVITGGSSGIGESLAYKFSKEKFNVMISGTNKDRLKSDSSNILSNGGTVSYTHLTLPTILRV